MPLIDHQTITALTAQAVTSVVIVDPHPPLREGLSVLLPSEGIDVLGGAATGAGGEALIARHEPDVALVAAELPDACGVALLRRLVERGLRSAIMLYADDELAPDHSTAAMHAGAAGVVTRRRTIAELATALRAVASGALWFDEAGDAAEEERFQTLPLAPPRRTHTLSSAELRVLALVAEGGSTEATAEALSISPHTVRTHMRNVMRKLEASSRAHAVAIAIREAAIQV